jgi:hypothetical protein
MFGNFQFRIFGFFTRKGICSFKNFIHNQLTKNSDQFPDLFS